MSGKERSVVDYNSNEALRNALASEDSDWKLKNFDKDTTTPQKLEAELERLATLRSYFVLDTAIEPEFEELTQQAVKLFNVPIAIVSLVDLGRQWFKSEQGLGGTKQTPRAGCSFCAHGIQRDDSAGIMVVSDATEDIRFKDNALVVGGPKIRFYAGAPLISPEGPKLGMFCIIDFKPRPQGLSPRELVQLKSLASEVVLALIMRKG